MRQFPMRRAPNAGGLQSVDIYVVAFDVEGVEPGVYYFDAKQRVLVQIDRGLMRRRVHKVCLSLQEWIAEAGAVLFLTCNVERLMWKYGKKSYRMTHLDAGVVADHLHLVATALGLGSCLVSGMFDGDAERLLGIDGRHEFPCLALSLGKLRAKEDAQA
jgi:SagB-type dehydrogenase family enzyme